MFFLPPSAGTNKKLSFQNGEPNPSDLLIRSHQLSCTKPHPGPCAAWPGPWVPQPPGGDAASPSARRPSAWCASQWRGRCPGCCSGCKASPVAGAGSCPWKVNQHLVGGVTPSEKYESQLGWLFPRYGKVYIKCSKLPTRWIFTQKVGWCGMKSDKRMIKEKKSGGLNRTEPFQKQNLH